MLTRLARVERAYPTPSAQVSIQVPQRAFAASRCACTLAYMKCQRPSFSITNLFHAVHPYRRQKLLMVQDALRYAGVPDRFSEKVQEYYEYLQQKSHPGAEGMQFLQVRQG